MFDVGTKVRLLASSARKQTSPRRGSLGYVSRINEHMYVDLERGAIVALANINFFRYGFEKKTRLERKEVGVVFPIIDRKKGDIQGQVLRLKDLVEGRGDSGWAMKMLSCVTLKPVMPLTIAVPVSNCGESLVDCSVPEFKSWIQSYLDSSSFNNFLETVLMTGHHTRSNYPPLANRAIWETLRSMVMDNDYRKHQFSNWIKSREKVITDLRMITAMAQRNNKKINYLGTLDLFIRNPKMSKSDAYNLMSGFVFNKPLIEETRHTLLPVASTPVLEYLEDIESAASVLLVLSDSLERKYSQA